MVKIMCSYVHVCVCVCACVCACTPPYECVHVSGCPAVMSYFMEPVLQWWLLMVIWVVIDGIFGFTGTR